MPYGREFLDGATPHPEVPGHAGPSGAEPPRRCDPRDRPQGISHGLKAPISEDRGENGEKSRNEEENKNFIKIHSRELI